VPESRDLVASAREAVHALVRFDGKVIRGKNGRLFLDNDTNEVIAQHTGAVRLDEAGLEQWRLILEHRVAWLERQGIPYHFLIAPNAHSVYPEDLPDDVPSADERPIHQIIGHLREKDSFAGVLYPLDELIAAKDEAIYPMTASHWSELGAFIAYRRLVQEISERLEIRALTLEDFDVAEQIQPGGLGHKVEPHERSVFVYLDFRAPRSRLTYDNRIVNNGRRVDYEGDERERFTCLVLGDSYARNLVPFLAENFRRLVFAHLVTLDHELVERERPDVVVSILSERFLIQVPVDVPSKTLDEFEQEKRAAGHVLPPRKVVTNRVDFPR
jgi:alginate O-acetyltransferase complex protein AlgJ